MRALLGLIAELTASAIAPGRCAACDAPVSMMRAFCGPCAATLATPEVRDPMHIAAFVYGGAVARAISRFKFEQRPDLARSLADALRRAARVLHEDPPDAVVPVPLHPSRLIERGYNQSALLANPVAKDLGARFLPRALARTRDTHRQVGLDRAERWTNVASGFAVPQPTAIVRKRVLLVDDVRTTGSTLRACAEALLHEGATEVRTLVIAQAEGSDDAQRAFPRVPRQ